MGKKAKEYKSGDFIFAKVKGYPAWPARVQRMNGKKYFVYFYGTGETANLPANMIFDYAENKDKFLTKTVKRRDFNDGVKQIEHDFANNVPLEQVIGANPEIPADAGNDTANGTVISEGMDETIDTTTADDTIADTTASNTTQNDYAVEDSDETGALVIDEGKQQPKGRKSKAEAKKEPPKTPKTPRGKGKKDASEKMEEEEEKQDEIVSRSGRKIRPKRYIDEQTEENSTLPSPAPKKRRGATPEKEKEKEKEKPAEKAKQFNNVAPAELEDLKEPFKFDADKENILIAYLPTGQYIGIKLFQSRPNSFKNDTVRLQWDKQAATNALTLKMQLEKGQITPQSILAQLVMNLNFTDEEKATLDKERETEEKRSRVQFLKTEMKLIELDAKIKTCLCLEKADTDLCLKLLDELTELDIKPLMLLKHPTCLETIKRMRAYVGNTPSWDLSESDAANFSRQAHRIRKQADLLYKNMKDLFTTPDGLSFWEFFSERVLQFKKATAKLNADELLEMVHEPLEMTQPTSHTLQAAVDAANEEEPPLEDEKIPAIKKKTPAKNKKTTNSTPSKRQSSRKQAEKKNEQEKSVEKETEKESNKEEESEKANEQTDKNSKTDDKNSKTDNKNGKTDDKNSKTNVSAESKDDEAPKDTEKENENATENVQNNEHPDEVEKITEDTDKASEEIGSKEKDLEDNNLNKKDSKKTDTVEDESKDKDSQGKLSKEKDSKGRESKEKDLKEKDSKGRESKEKDLKEKDSKEKESKGKDARDKDSNEKDRESKEKESKEKEKESKEKKGDDKRRESRDRESKGRESKEKESKEKEKESKGKEDVKETESKEKDKQLKRKDSKEKESNVENDKSEKEKDKQEEKDEPRAKRSRGESKKTEPPPPRSPTKRKAKN